MCGIFGAIRLDGGPGETLQPLVEKGISLLRHRGPDGWGVKSSGPVCFAHARLSIIDLEGGAQPMRGDGDDILITYNGEIYNYMELRSDLEKNGVAFHTNSDTETALYSYGRWGSRCLKKFRGMFALACVDFRSKKALIARDRLGKKPLFYTVSDGAFFFSSELEPLYKTVGPFPIDIEAMDEYLYWQYVPAPRTIYKGVHSLEPAHFIEIDLQRPQVKPIRYWTVNFTEDRSLSLAEWEDKLDNVIRESVRIRLRSDVPFGAFLSGGIDSSVVTGYMSQMLSSPVKTFTIGFKHADFNEVKYAEEVSRISGSQQHTEIVEADSLGILPLLAERYGQPFADSSAIPTYYVSRMARRHVKMVLSGDGGDESFAGYNTYENILNALDVKAHGTVGIAKRILTAFARLSRKLGGNGMAYTLHSSMYSHFTPESRRRLLNDKYVSAVVDRKMEREPLMGRNIPLVSRLQRLDMLTYLPYDILVKVDIASMANSLEVRCPLLDHVLIETAATMPVEHKIRRVLDGSGVHYDKKRILKNLVLRKFPTEVIERKKQGFGVPLGIWFAGELRNEIRRRLLGSPHLPAFFNMKTIEDLLDSHTVSNDQSPRIWNLLFLEQWMRGHEDSLTTPH